MLCKICSLLCSRCIVSTTRNGGKLDGKENSGNFTAFLNVLGEHGEILQKHLNFPTMNNATYLFPDTENESINIIKTLDIN